MNFNNLYSHIGSYDEKLDCLYPVYLLHPEIPKYKIIQDEAYFKPIIKKHFKQVNSKEPQKGDLLVFKLFNGFHFGIYAGNNDFFHCCKKHKLRVSKLSIYNKFLKDIYRWYKQ